MLTASRPELFAMKDGQFMKEPINQGGSAQGSLLSTKIDVEVAFANVRTLMDEKLSRMVDAISPQLAAASNREQVKELLDRELRRAILETARELDLRAASLLSNADSEAVGDVLDRARTLATAYSAAADGFRAESLRNPESN